MSDFQKHTFDLFSFLMGLAAWMEVFSKILGFFVALAGAVWWGIRFYEWWKDGK